MSPAFIEDIDLWLELGAKFSLIVCLLVVIYVFSYTTWRIAGMQYRPGLWTPWGEERQEIHQRPTPLPFTFSLVDSSLEKIDEFSFRLSAHAPSIKCLWGMDAGDLYKLINGPSWQRAKDLHNSGDDDPFLFAQSLHLAKGDASVDYEVTINTPSEVDWNQLSGRYKYPLVIFFQSDQESHEFEGNETSVVALCVVLHVKNALFPRSTAILAQYIKLANGQTHKLQPLYVMDGSAEDADAKNDEDSTNEPFSQIICSVCQAFPVSRAIVPCGHVCLCAHCFSKVTTCPICRGLISYYFKTRDESYMQT